MRILHTNMHKGWGGGHTTYITSLLRDGRHEHYVACAESSRLYRLLAEQGFGRLIPVDFTSRLGRPLALLQNTLALKRAIEYNSIDIVHTNGSPDNRMALYVSLLCRRKFKVVFTKHNTNVVKGMLSKWRLNSFNDAVIFVSESVIPLSGLTPGHPRYHVVEHGIDLDYWRNTRPIETGKKLRLVSNAGTPTHKGWPGLLEAIAQLPPDARARLSVTVLGRPDAALEKAQHRARGLYEIDLPGFHEDTRPFLEDGDIGFVLSRREASSFASREMSAMSLPVLSSDFPNAFKNVEHDVNGWIIRTDDLASLRGALLEILALPPERLNSMKKAAREKAERDFSIEKMLTETSAVYDAVCRPE